MDAQAATKFIRSVRAVRRFADREIPVDTLRDVIETARWTGSAKNVQPWHVVVVRDRAMLGQLAACGEFAYHLKGARLGIVLVMASRGYAFDAGRLTHNVMLGAWAHGVGSCIAYFQPDDNQAKAKELLGIPDDRWVPTGISLGYPADEAALRISSDPGRTSGFAVGRMPLDQFVSWEKFRQTA